LRWSENALPLALVALIISPLKNRLATPESEAVIASKYRTFL
jgi:hypothetical protein